MSVARIVTRRTSQPGLSTSTTTSSQIENDRQLQVGYFGPLRRNLMKRTMTCGLCRLYLYQSPLSESHWLTDSHELETVSGDTCSKDAPSKLMYIWGPGSRKISTVKKTS